MNKWMKIIIIILIMILLTSIGFNLYKYVYKDKINKKQENENIFNVAYNNLKNIKNLSINKEVNYNFNESINDISYDYDIDLEKKYISGEIIDSSSNREKLYVIKDDKYYFIYRNNKWDKHYSTNSIILYDTCFLDDYNDIINILNSITNYENTSDNTYKLFVKDKALKNILRAFINFDSDPMLYEVLWLSTNKINYNDIGVYLTFTDDKKIDELVFDLRKVNTRVNYYTITFSNYNKAKIKIPTDILADIW